MAYLNKVLLIGRLGRDPEITFVGDTNKKMARFSIACSCKRRNDRGETVEHTDWNTIVCWGNIPTILERIKLSKGDMVYVEGSVGTRRWVDNGGNPHNITEITASTVQLLSKRYGENDANGESDGAPANDGLMTPAEVDDLPF